MSTPYKKVLKLICVFLILAKPSLSVSGNYANQGEDWTGSCAVNGTTQSPFSISAGTNDPNLQGLYLQFDDWTGTLSFTANNYILKLDRPSNSNGRAVIKYSGNKCSYTALRLQFHAPAEHSVNFRYRDLQAQIILKKDKSSCGSPGFIGLSFLFDSDVPQSNEFLNNLGINDSAAAGGNALLTGTAGIPKAITDKKSSGFWTYTGSLTSGNCEQVCLWLIAQGEYKITANQQAFFDNLWKNNPGFQKAAGQGNNRVLMNKLHSRWYDHNRRSYSIPESRILFQSKSISGSDVQKKIDPNCQLLQQCQFSYSLKFNLVTMVIVAAISGLWI